MSKLETLRALQARVRESKGDDRQLSDDILIDDWEKYRAKWLAVGGVWITHTSAAETIVALARALSQEAE